MDIITNLEINPAPVAVGACAYLVFWAVSRLTSRRQPLLPRTSKTVQAARAEEDRARSGLEAGLGLPRRCRSALVFCAAAVTLALGLYLALAPGYNYENDLQLQAEVVKPAGEGEDQNRTALPLAVDLPAPAPEQRNVPSAEPEAEGGEGLKVNSAITTLNLQNNQIGDEVAREVEEASEDMLPSVDLPVSVPAPGSPLEVGLPEFASPAQPLTVKLTRQTMDTSQPNYIRSAYYGTLMVGNPPQPFTVVFDTGSGHLVLPSTYCHSPTCKAHRRYSRRASASGRDVNYDGERVEPGEARDQIAVSFGTGEVTGVLVEDVICVGEAATGTANATANGSLAMTTPGPDENGCIKMRMIAATSLSEDPFDSFQFDGLLGLGLEGLSQAPDFNFMGVILRNLEQTGAGLSSTFGVFLAENQEEDSEIALGGWAQRHLAEDLSWTPVHDPDQGHWIVPVRRIRVGGRILPLCETGECKAAVDTGTSLLAVPTNAFTEIYQGLRHLAPKSGHCQGHGPLLHIELEHFTVTLGPRDYARIASSKVQKQRGLYSSKPDPRSRHLRQDLRCVPMLMTLDLPEPLGPDLIILGEPVLRKYYTVFDARRKYVGFGRAKHRQAPSREDLLMMAPDLDKRTGHSSRGRLSPSMFDVFRWRSAL